MPTPILSTKLYVPPLRPNAVMRPRLIERLNNGLRGKLTLVSAAAGFGKTTLVSAWAADCGRPVAWLSLGEDDSDPARFLTYIVAALQTIDAGLGRGVLGALQAPQAPPPDAALTVLLNEIAANSREMVLVLDDYHTIESQDVDKALAFLVEHLPPQLHLVIATREDPPLLLARLRVRGHINEIRAADLRFTHAEAADFLNLAMGLKLSKADIVALERRTEGWIAGLQLAALSMQGLDEPSSFIESFTGSHHFVLDYLLEEVLSRQPENIQHFLLQTSILDRLCGPLCDSLLSAPSGRSQFALQQLEHANLFIVPLDSERRWYRYHHLFGDLLRQRLLQTRNAADLHLRASQWYEDNGLDLDAFQHAAAANDTDRAARLVLGDEMPLFFRGGVVPVLHWLESLPASELDVRPALRVMHASARLFMSSVAGVEENLQAAEKALQHAADDAYSRNLIGHIALIRATVGVSQRDAETIYTQSQRALEYLHPDNLPMRTATIWTLGVAKTLQGDRAAAERAFHESLARSEAIGHFIIILMSSIGLGDVLEADNRLGQARDMFQHALQRAGEPPLPVLCEAHRGLGRIAYQWNDLDAAQHHAEQSVRLGRQIANRDWFSGGEILLARIQMARGDAAGALAMLSETEQRVRRYNFDHWLPMIAAAQIEAMIQAGQITDAAKLSQAFDLPIPKARIHLAQGNPKAALAGLAAACAEAEAKSCTDERLRIMAVQAVALQVDGQRKAAQHLIDDVITLAAPGGFIRLFVDEGRVMYDLIAEAAARKRLSEYISQLLAAFEADGLGKPIPPSMSKNQALIEPLSPRELEILRLIDQGLSNSQIGERLYLALSTVKGHNQSIFGKLQVQRRTEALTRARELGLL
jgi:LuxR family maltose regulon positive regulatory protein